MSRAMRTMAILAVSFIAVVAIFFRNRLKGHSEAPAPESMEPGTNAATASGARSSWQLDRAGRRALVRLRDSVRAVLKPPGTTARFRDALDGDDSLHATDPVAFNELSEAAKSGLRPELDACIGEFKERHPPKPDRYYAWELRFVVHSENGVGTVSDVRLPEGKDWPPMWDQTVRDCFIEALSVLEFVTHHDYDYETAYPFCTYPKEEDSAGSEHEASEQSGDHAL